MTSIDSSVMIRSNNMRKAMTERVVCGNHPERVAVWWKSLMKKAYENHSRAVIPKTKVIKYYRKPALRDKICWNLK